jgi:peptide/nickel transport system substrate-binding protein
VPELGRRELLRGLAVTGALTGAGGLLAACGHSAANPAGAAHSRTPKRGGNLKIGMSGGSSSDTLDPHQGLTYLDTGRFEALYQPLVKLSGTAAIEYVLAESITPNRGSLSEWIIKIRPGVTFHSGKDLTADDVVYTIQRIISKGFSGAHFFGPTDLKNVKALDKLTVQVPMASPSAALSTSSRAAGITSTSCQAALMGKTRRHRALRFPELHPWAAQCVRAE